VVFVAPGQIMGSPDDGEYHHARGYVLMFHPDFLRNSSLADCMKDYTFFSYESNEALHLSKQERKIILECFDKIQAELQHPIDKHTKSLIIDNIKLFLDYSMRFYDRQFITRENINHDMLTRFEKELDHYFNSDLPEKIGLPSVQYFAEKLNLSANYFSDLIKKETGMNALKYIHLKLLDIAKTKVLDPSKSFSEIAYELGFKYPQHFSRFFKREIGCSPNEYRAEN
jgi:AraC-like DNA-binding protein